jgi:phage terminase large subunit GpA-like protein
MSSTLADLRRGWVNGLRPEVPLTVTEWADKYRILNQKASGEAGPWRTSRTPYLKAIMDDLSSSSDVETVTFMKSAQIGGTECGNNWIGYLIDHSPGPALVVEPTVDLAKRWSRQRLGPMIDDMSVLNAKVQDSRSRDSGNTVLSKDFDGGILVATGANSAAGLRSMPVKFLMLDEIDAYPLDVDDEGDPVDLAIERTKNFTRKKIFKISTPTTEGTSRIAKSYAAGDMRKLHLPCPHCAEMQSLEFSNLRWSKDADNNHQPETVRLYCKVNGCEIEEYHKTWMLERCEWVITGRPNSKHHSYHINSLYSPLGWEAWEDLVIKFLAAKSDETKLKTFTNTSEGLPFAAKGKKIDGDTLKDRAEDYPLRIVPMGGLVLVAGVDTQDNRFEVVVWAEGLNQHIWAIDYHVIYGSPSLQSTREELDEYLATPFPHAAGCELSIKGVGIDSGGHHTQDVYDYCRIRKARNIFATKSYSVSGRAIIGKPSKVDVTIHGKTIKNGAEVWMIGSDTAKSLIYSRLANEDAEVDGYIHISKYFSDSFFKQLVSERLETHYHKGFARMTWQLPPGVRNEVLDCTVGAKVATYKLGLHRWRPAQWRALEQKVQPATPDLFAAAEVAEQKETADQIVESVKQPARARPRHRRPPRGGFVLGGMRGG